jgi:hypothetical protein
MSTSDDQMFAFVVKMSAPSIQLLASDLQMPTSIDEMSTIAPRLFVSDEQMSASGVAMSHHELRKNQLKI